MDPVELHAVFTAGGPPKPAARAFVDYLAAELRRDGFSTPEA
jgi:hypothetical protein